MYTAAEIKPLIFIEYKHNYYNIEEQYTIS